MSPKLPTVFRVISEFVPVMKLLGCGVTCRPQLPCPTSVGSNAGMGGPCDKPVASPIERLVCGPESEVISERFAGTDAAGENPLAAPTRSGLPGPPKPGGGSEAVSGIPRNAPPPLERSKSVSAKRGPKRCSSTSRLFSSASAIASWSERYRLPPRRRLSIRLESWNETGGTYVGRYGRHCWWHSDLSSLCAGAALGAMKTDIEFAKAGDLSLTLDASVPGGPGPFRP